MTARRTAHLTVVLGVLGILTACSGPEPATPTLNPTHPTPTAVGTISIQPAPTGATEEGGPVPADASSQDEQHAIDAAQATMDVWIQGSTLDQQTWQQQLAATLTPIAQQAYAGRYGYKIPDTQLVEDPVVIRANTESATVRMSTDVTTYEVTVVRTDDTWLTSAITPWGGDSP